MKISEAIIRKATASAQRIFPDVGEAEIEAALSAVLPDIEREIREELSGTKIAWRGTLTMSPEARAQLEQWHTEAQQRPITPDQVDKLISELRETIERAPAGQHEFVADIWQLSLILRVLEDLWNGKITRENGQG